MEIAASRAGKTGSLRIVAWSACGAIGPGRPAPAAAQGMRRKARTVRAIVQNEEPGGNPGSVRTQGGFLPAQLDFAASLTFLPERGWRFRLGFGQWSVEHYLGGSTRSAVAAARRAGYPWSEQLGPQLL